MGCREAQVGKLMETKAGNWAKDQMKSQREGRAKNWVKGQAEGPTENQAEGLVKSLAEDPVKNPVERESLDFVHAGVRYRFVRWRVDACEEGSASESASRPYSARPMVLLHGFAQNALSWDGVASYLAQHHVVYAFDFVGHGESERPSDQAPYEMNAVCEALLAFLRFVQCEHDGFAPAVVGYSMGGRIALAATMSALATDSDIPFSMLALESAGLGPATPDERDALARRNEENARRVQEEGVAKFMEAWERLPLFATQQTLPESVRLGVREQRLSNDSFALAQTFRGTGAQRMPYRSQSLAALASLQEKGIAAHYIAGQLDEKYVEVAKLLERERVRVRVVPRAGHNAHLECPEAFLQILADILAR